jgi:CRISPR-associated exonuclease Cas4
MGIVVALASLIFALAVFWALWTGRRACQAQRHAALPTGRLISVDAIAPHQLAGIPVQDNLQSTRYGISGRPDRIVRTERGFVPVDVKYSRCPPSGPHANHLAQVAVYCLLVEEHFGSRVPEAILEYIDGSFTVPFDGCDRLLMYNADIVSIEGIVSKPEERSWQHRWYRWIEMWSPWS